jgi:hypothetical protein
MVWKLFVMAALYSAITVAGENPYIEPKTPEKVPFSATLTPGGAVDITLDRQRYVVKAEFSLRPGWAKFTEDKAEGFTSMTGTGKELTAEGPGFKLVRHIEMADEAITVTDRITNTSSENLPFLYRQYVTIDTMKEYRLCGYRVYSSHGTGNDSINSTTIVMPEDGGSLGMLALNDVFRVHFKAFARRKSYGIGDDELVIKPGVTQEMSFALFPSRASDYYSQINAMRRYLGVNYEIPCGFTYMAPNPKGVKSLHPDYDQLGKDSTIEEICDRLNYKSVDYVCDLAVPLLGEPHQGSAWLELCKPQLHRDFYKKIREARPTAKIFHFFHCFIEFKDRLGKGFENDKCLLPNGNQADYRNPNVPLYLPFEGGKWAECKEKTLDKLKNDFGVDGIFWDEFPYSATRYHYGAPWDGVSADIDPRTHEILRLKSSVPLVTLPWRKRMVEWIADNKLMLIANGGGAHTRTMMEVFKKYKFLAFRETGAISNLYVTHLSTPIGLADHITERNEKDCYHNVVKQLDYGCVYFYYHEQVAPFTHETITKHMFPITPIELHEGYIIGKERILTNRSGIYGFGDVSEAELHFYNADGYEVERKPTTIKKDGKLYYEIALGEMESCAIVRK